MCFRCRASGYLVQVVCTAARPHLPGRVWKVFWGTEPATRDTEPCLGGHRLTVEALHRSCQEWPHPLEESQSDMPRGGELDPQQVGSDNNRAMDGGLVPTPTLPCTHHPCVSTEPAHPTQHPGPMHMPLTPVRAKPALESHPSLCARCRSNSVAPRPTLTSPCPQVVTQLR